MSQEDDRPITLLSHGWEEMPDGRWRLVVVCETVVHYSTLPKSLLLGEEELHKQGWDSEKKVAFYYTGQVPQDLAVAE